MPGGDPRVYEALGFSGLGLEFPTSRFGVQGSGFRDLVCGVVRLPV